MLDLPTTRHLLDDQLGVHAYLELCIRSMPAGELQAGNQTAIFGNVVGRYPYRLGCLRDDLAGLSGLEDGAVRSRPRVATRTAIGLDHDSNMRSHLDSGPSGAYQDATALLTTQPFVGFSSDNLGQLGRVELKPAATAPLLDEGSDA